MPAVTPTETQSLPVIADAIGDVRPVEHIATAISSFEGAGFPVRRPFPGALDSSLTDPFLMLDQMGPIVYAPRQALGAPDHPHRGFETVTYLLDGEMEHRDSYGGGGVIRGGDTQWMTAGSGLVHSEMPTDKMMREGGLLHGVQLWVNLPRADKRAEPRYQDLSGEELTLLRNADDTALVRLIAGDLAGVTGAGPHAYPDRARARDAPARRTSRTRLASRVQCARLRAVRFRARRRRARACAAKRRDRGARAR